VRVDQDRRRRDHAIRQASVRLLTLTEARLRAVKLAFDETTSPRPAFLGVRAFDGVPLSDLVAYVDWTPFFQAWEMKGKYPAILSDPAQGEAARRIFEDAQAALSRIVAERRVRARGVFGFFPASRVGDDVEAYADDERRAPVAILHTLRRQVDGGANEACPALADFVAARGDGVKDHVGAFAVGVGDGVADLVREHEARHDDYGAILVKALADRLVEALAERLHEIARAEWGFGKTENLSKEDLLRERWRGIRPAPGYPACPDHDGKRTILSLLDAERLAGVSATESGALLPAAAVCGLYFAHPKARYFSVGRIGRDQASDYARRRGVDVAVVEAALRPWLGYESDP
jgi:5-methyltetrahydrofolate--homocysteine methyltransferase